MTHSPPRTWLPERFEHPVRVAVDTDHHLRPIRADDIDIDFPAVMGSRQRLWAMFGELWGWPPETMTVEQDRVDLARHEAEMAAHESFNYALLDTAETELLGCVYIDPPSDGAHDAAVAWWVVERLVGSTLEQALDDLVPRWLARDWPFERIRWLLRD